jgi:hypothetical protein
MKPRVAFLFVLTLIVAPLMFGQTLTVGLDIATPNSSDSNIAPTRTDISLDNPATADGSITSVKVYWSSSGCTNAVKIKFFRRTGDLLTPIGDRGPFTPTGGVSTFTMSPAVGVHQGDLIGLARVANCGNPGTLTGVVGEGYLSFEGDVQIPFSVVDGARSGSPLALFGSGTPTGRLAAVFPVVGSVNGAFGSSFKTSMQLLNPSSSTMNGVLVFHHAGVAANIATDPGFPFSIPAGQLMTIPDLGSTIIGPGLGSLDMGVNEGSGTPQVVTRVYNDAGTSGTAGFVEDPIAYPGEGVLGSRVVSMGATAFMVTPLDPSRTRFNIGVRTLYSGATLRAQLLDNAGHVLASVNKTYTANYFEQVDSTSFFGGVPVGANQIIKISVSDGSAIIYGATTDNVTNDPSVQYALVAFAIL